MLLRQVVSEDIREKPFPRDIHTSLMTQIRQGQRLESQKEPKMKPIKALSECTMRNRFRFYVQSHFEGRKHIQSVQINIQTCF